MTAVFVHGVPETGRLWDRLRAGLPPGSIALGLPGFGVPRPDGFGATMDDYVEWLVRELHELHGLRGPVDLVGHTPAGQLTAAGVPAADAGWMGAEFDATMAQCVLDLYRSATPNPHTHWAAARSTPTTAPGLVLQPSLDPYDDQAASDHVAARLGARTRRLDGLGHWWTRAESHRTRGTRCSRSPAATPSHSRWPPPSPFEVTPPVGRPATTSSARSCPNSSGTPRAPGTAGPWRSAPTPTSPRNRCCAPSWGTTRRSCSPGCAPSRSWSPPRPGCSRTTPCERSSKPT